MTSNLNTLIVSCFLLLSLASASQKGQCVNCIYNEQYLCDDNLCLNEAEYGALPTGTQDQHDYKKRCMKGNRKEIYSFARCFEYSQKLNDFVIDQTEKKTIHNLRLDVGDSVMMKVNSRAGKNGYINIKPQKQMSGDENVLFFAYREHDNGTYGTIYNMTQNNMVLLPESEVDFYVWVALQGDTMNRVELFATGASKVVMGLVAGIAALLTYY